MTTVILCVVAFGLTDDILGCTPCYYASCIIIDTSSLFSMLELLLSPFWLLLRTALCCSTTSFAYQFNSCLVSFALDGPPRYANVMKTFLECRQAGVEPSSFLDGLWCVFRFSLFDSFADCYSIMPQLFGRCAQFKDRVLCWCSQLSSGVTLKSRTSLRLLRQSTRRSTSDLAFPLAEVIRSFKACARQDKIICYYRFEDSQSSWQISYP